MTAYNIIGWLIIIFWVYLFLHSPILKPWFGFRKPKNPLPGHKWFR
jgi:hypothetical protein